MRKQILFLPFFLLLLNCNAQTTVKIIGQFTGITPGEINAVSVKAQFLENGSQTFPVSQFGLFTGTVSTNESGIAALTFKNYTYHFVIAAEPVLRMSIEARPDSQFNISIEDLKENAAYQFASILMSDQDRMNSYFANCAQDSCVRMMQIEENAYRRNRDSIIKLYPGTYSADVLCRIWDFHAPAEAKLLPPVMKSEILNQTPWQISSAYNSSVMNKLAGLYLDYAPDTGATLGRSIKNLLDKTAPASLARNRLANTLFDIFVDDIQDDGLKQFLALAKDTSLFTDLVLREKCRRYTQVVSGETAPEINLPDSSGREISLRDIAGRNKYTLLVIWNPDCPHCIAAMPVLREVYKKYHPKGLEIYAVSLNRERYDWLAAVRKNKCDWINVQVTEKKQAQPEAYFITYTPALVLINKEGAIVNRRLPVEELKHSLRGFFAE